MEDSETRTLNHRIEHAGTSNNGEENEREYFAGHIGTLESDTDDLRTPAGWDLGVLEHATDNRNFASWDAVALGNGTDVWSRPGWEFQTLGNNTDMRTLEENGTAGEDFVGSSNDSSGPFSSVCNWSANEPTIMGHSYPSPELLLRATTLDSYERLQIALIVALVVISVAGNVAVVAVVYFNRYLRSTVNYYLANLAVADLLITLACWPTLVNRFTEPLYLLGRPLCKITVFALGTCVNVSALTLAVVAGGRLYAVLFPLRNMRSASRPFLVISLLWAASITLALPAFYVRDTRLLQWDDLLEESCGDIFCDSFLTVKVYRYYKILLLITMFFLPELVMVVAYTVIIVRLYCVRRGPKDEVTHAAPPHHSHHHHHHHHPSASATSSSTAPTADHAHMSARRKVVKMTAAVVVVFTLCWSPLHALILFSLLSEGPEHPPPIWSSTAVFWAYFLGYCNSALNPLLYCGCSERFRAGLKSLVFRRPRWPRQRLGVGSGHSWSPSSLLLRLTSSSLSSKSSVGGVISRQTSKSLPHTTDSARSSRRQNSRRGFYRAHSKNSESVRSNLSPEISNNGEKNEWKTNQVNNNEGSDIRDINEVKDGNDNQTKGKELQDGKEKQMETKITYEKEQASEDKDCIGEEAEGIVGSPLLSVNHENRNEQKKQNITNELNDNEGEGIKERVTLEGEKDVGKGFLNKKKANHIRKNSKQMEAKKKQCEEGTEKEDTGSRLLCVADNRKNTFTEHREKSKTGHDGKTIKRQEKVDAEEVTSMLTNIENCKGDTEKTSFLAS